jgi:hypothetical protein
VPSAIGKKPAQKGKLPVTEPSDIGETFRTRQCRQQCQQQNLVEPVENIPRCLGSGISLKYLGNTVDSKTAVSALPISIVPLRLFAKNSFE